MKPAEDLDERLRAIRESPTYRLAYEDIELLGQDELRPLRLQLELLKPERILHEQGIRSTVVVFGSARVSDAETAEARLGVLERQALVTPEDVGLRQELARANRRVEQARHYEQARRFSGLISARFQQQNRRDFVVVTGGGPGIMEAANRGAFEVGARSIGLNITLPHEQAPNPYMCPDLAFRFHYFALRKMHFLLHAKGLVAFPGGYGTLDELFEVLTLIQTRKMQRVPVVLVGRAFWRRVVDFDLLLDEGYVSSSDLDLFTRHWAISRLGQPVAQRAGVSDGHGAQVQAVHGGCGPPWMGQRRDRQLCPAGRKHRNRRQYRRGVSRGLEHTERLRQLSDSPWRGEPPALWCCRSAHDNAAIGPGAQTWGTCLPEPGG